jgi:hypothetical protein
MESKKTRLTARFVNSELLTGTYRRLNFKDVKNKEGIIIKDIFCIDESENLRAINLTSAHHIGFEIDGDFNVLHFDYPHDGRMETYSKIQQKGKTILEKLQHRRNNNEGSE